MSKRGFINDIEILNALPTGGALFFDYLKGFGYDRVIGIADFIIAFRAPDLSGQERLDTVLER